MLKIVSAEVPRKRVSTGIMVAKQVAYCVLDSIAYCLGSTVLSGIHGTSCIVVLATVFVISTNLNEMRP